MNERKDENIVINEVFERLEKDFETRKSLFLNVIFKNIDILVSNSQQWFGETVPTEYSRVIKSLINLTVSYLEENEAYLGVMTDTSYRVFSADAVIHSVLGYFSGMIHFKKYDIITTGKTEINTSMPLFEDSIRNLFMAISPYMTKETKCTVKVDGSSSQVSISISVFEMSPDIPEVSRLMRLIYSTNDEHGKSKIRIGLNIALDEIKKIGGTVGVRMQDEGSIDFKIIFPSYEFLKTISDIRSVQQNNILNLKIRTVYISLPDRLTEILLRDNLCDMGYDAKIIKFEMAYKAFDISKPGAIIADISKISQVLKLKQKSMPLNTKCVFIKKHGQNTEQPEGDGNYVISYPIDIEEIGKILE